MLSHNMIISSRTATTTRTATRTFRRPWHIKPVLVVAISSILALAPTIISSAFAATLSGTNGDDTLRGTNDSDTIYGYGGDDKIYGYGGNDKLYGGRGDDRIKGGTGDDYIYGWYGGNTLYGGTGNDHIYTTAPLGGGSSSEKNYVYGDAGDDYIKSSVQVAIIYGGSGSDNIDARGDDMITPTVYAESGNDIVYTFDGAAYGGTGDDYLTGNGASAVFGEDGDDTLVTNGGDQPSLTGGKGADHFDCRGNVDVTIRDFNPDEGDTKTNCPEA
jgi:Ca2+-binding RTX toxin-like protein